MGGIGQPAVRERVRQQELAELVVSPGNGYPPNRKQRQP